MSALNTFFSAWSETDEAKRSALIEQSCTPDATYSDPRSGQRISDHAALVDYVGMFSANAPGWTATVIKSDDVNGYVRALVAFGGMGPDGKDMVQHGTYFANVNDAGLITMLAGFVGVAGIE